jgi:hypothetical protein
MHDAVEGAQSFFVRHFDEVQDDGLFRTEGRAGRDAEQE